jgi:hypothetical protein
MIECSCSEDGYVLAIITLILSKVMAWYAAAAGRAQINEEDGGSVTGRSSRSTSVHYEQVVRRPEVVRNYHLKGKDSDRMAAQLVLSELHRVQRLVTSLSEKLKTKTESEGLTTPSSMASGQIGTPAASALPFSASAFNLLEADLRKKLRSLSLNIVESLRRDS